MLTCFSKKPFFNKALSDYCFQSTIKSIQNIIERYQLERKMIWNDCKERFKYSNLTSLLHQLSFNMPPSGAEIPKGGLDRLLCASSMRKGVKNPNPNSDSKPYIPLFYIFYKHGRFTY